MTDSSSSNEHLPVGAIAQSQTPPATLQRLHQRRLQPFGAINTQPVHRHSTQPGTTAARLMRRLDLPEQTQSRYESGVVRMTFSPRFNGRRTELSGLGGEGMVQRSPSGFEQEDSDRASSSLFPETSTPSSTVERVSTPTPTPKQLVKVIKSASSSAIQLTESQARKVVPRPETPLADSTSDLASGVFWISRRTVPSAAVAATSVSPPDEGNAAKSTSSLFSSENSASSSPATERGSTHQELPLAVPTPTQSSEINPIAAQPSVSTSLPQIQAKLESPQTVGVAICASQQRFAIAPTPAQKVGVSLQPRYRQGDLVLRSPVVSDKGGQGTVFASPRSPSSSWQFNGASTSHATMNSQSKAGATDALPVVKISAVTTPSVQSKSQPRGLSLHPQTQREGDGNLAATSPVQESRPLYTPLVSTTVIQRQEAIATPTEPSFPVESSVGMTNTTSPPVPPVVSAAASEVDVVQIAEQVSRILYRQAVVERERRGLAR